MPCAAGTASRRPSARDASAAPRRAAPRAAKRRAGGFGGSKEERSPLGVGGWRHGGGRLEDAQAFAAWAQEQGLPEQAVTLRPVKGQGRGLIAERDISAGELLLRVPQRLLLTRARALEELPEAYAAVLGSLPEYSVLAAFLALAATPGMVPETYFAPYLRALPTASGCVLEWPSLGVRELLRGSPTLPRALERRAQADFMREELQGALQGAGLPVPPDGAVTWALSMLLSRAVRLESLEGEGEGEGEGELALVPWADFANHSTRANEKGAHIDWRRGAGAGSGAVYLPAGGDYKRGEQVYASYGDRTSAELMLSYGFVPPTAPPCEAVDVALALPADDEHLQAKAAALEARGLNARLQPFPVRLTGSPPEMLSYALVAAAEPRSAEEATQCVAAAFGEAGSGVVGDAWAAAGKDLLADVARDMAAGYPGSLKADDEAAEGAGFAIVDTMDEREAQLSKARYCAAAAVRTRERRVLARLEFVMSSGAAEDFAAAEKKGRDGARNVPEEDGVLGSLKSALPEMPEMPEMPDMRKLFK